MSKITIFIYINDGMFEKYYNLEELKKEHNTIYNIYSHKKYKVENKNSNLSLLEYDIYERFYAFETMQDIKDLEELFKTSIFKFYNIGILKLIGSLELIKE